MIGKMYNDWFVIEEVKTGSPARHYRCKCKCGIIKIVRNDSLKSGKSGRCAECRHKNLLKVDETLGKRFGKWIVLEKIDNNKKAYKYLCLCDCGNKCEISGNALRRGRTMQCRKCSLEKHNMTDSKTYNTWRCMRSRCNSIKSHEYYLYGGRGIKVCDAWNNFINFYNDMGERPEGKKLDRIDTNGDYYKENCRWVTPKENSNNRRPYKTVNMYTKNNK